MSETEKQNKVSDAKGLAKFFELDIELKLFGISVWKWHFPPKS